MCVCDFVLMCVDLLLSCVYYVVDVVVGDDVTVVVAVLVPVVVPVDVKVVVNDDVMVVAC